MFVYILRCTDGTLYTGIASDIKRRFKQHRGEIRGGAKYTHVHGAEYFEAVWETDSSTAARKMECALKKLKRSQKEMLTAAPEKITTEFIPELAEYQFRAVCSGKNNSYFD